MTSIQIKNVPDDVHAGLRRRAGVAGQSLQEYLLAEVTRSVRTPTMAEVLERIGHRTGGRLRLEQAVADIRADRDER